MVKFIVDSTFGLSREYLSENDIKVVTLTLLLNGNEIEEGFPDEWDAFYSEYVRTKAVVKTSQPSPDKFREAIDAIFEKDENSEIIIFTIADRLSGTIGSATIAASQYPNKRVVAVNSGVAGTSGLMFIQEMVKAQQEGATFDELLELANDLKERIAMQFIPASLTELARGGRVNKLLSRVGNILKIKPVFEFAKNDLTIYAKALGFNRAVAAAIARLPEKFDRILVYYIGDDKNVEALKDRLFRKFGLSQIDVEPMCPVGGAHIGVGTVGIVTLASKEQ
ncbi:MAG: DegV family protein [Clostridiales bacterium]|nr:DegV family protein [Clostridiales bacterium]